jgi:cathepsin E
MFPASLLSTLLLALAVAASPVVIERSPVTLPISRRFNFTGSANILQKDQARAAALKAKGRSIRANGATPQRAVVNEVVDNVAEVYQASVGVGNPATQCQLLL